MNNLNNLLIVNDKKLAEKLEKHVWMKDKVELVFRRRSVLLSINDVFVAKGEFFDKSYEILKNNSSNISIYIDVITIDENNYTSQLSALLKKKIIESWDIGNIPEWKTKSRFRADLSKSLKIKVYLSSMNFCQKCFIDLSVHSLNPKETKNSEGEIAHIEGAGFDGPRSNPYKEDCNNLENLMLLCQKCHTEIDNINPDEYTPEVLKIMKFSSENEVSYLRRCLNGKEIIVLKAVDRFSKIKHLISGFEIDSAIKRFNIFNNESFRQYKTNTIELLSLQDRTYNQYYCFNENYWKDVFCELKENIAHLRNIQKKYPDGVKMALFCAHNISASILIGRVLGYDDSKSIVFFPLQRNGGREPWSWKNESEKKLEFLNENSSVLLENIGNEILLTVEISACLKYEDLPLNIYNKKLLMPVVSVEVENPDPSAIDILEKVNQVKKKVAEKINRIQDEYKCTKIHLIVIAPIPINFVVGQCLQDRHHSDVVCYEKDKESNKFKETILITKNRVYFYENKDVFYQFD